MGASLAGDLLVEGQISEWVERTEPVTEHRELVHPIFSDVEHVMTIVGEDESVNDCIFANG